MGEWSKTVGDAGESIATLFLQMIGWGSAQHGVAVICARPELHSLGGETGQRRTHGIDFLTTQKSPLIDGLGQNLLISVKFSAKPYPTNPIRLFKQHFTDLAQTVECFKTSEKRAELLQTVRGVYKTHDIGVLLWLNNSRDGKNDVISEVDSVVLPDTLNYEAIYVVDNRRAQFIFDSVHFAKEVASGRETAFFYPDTGTNFNPVTKETHGSFLPVEYINTSVLAFRIADTNSAERMLLISTIESFSEEALKRLMGLAQSISQNWCCRVIVAFPDYDKLNHGNTVRSVKSCFSDASFVDSTEVRCYDHDFRTLNS